MSGPDINESPQPTTEGAAFLRSLYEHATEGIEHVAPDGRLLMANAALCRMLGYRQAELLGKCFDVIIPPEDRSREAKLLDKVLAGQYKCVDIEKRLLHRSGTPVWTIVSSLPVTKGASAPYCMSIIRDVTEPRLARAQLGLAVEAALAAMVLVGEDGTILLANPFAEELFGYRAGELLQQPLEILVPERSRGGHPGLRQEFLRAPQDRIMGGTRELTGRRKDGSEIPIEVNLHAIGVERRRWVLASIVDISSRKQAQMALHESEDRLRILLESTGEGIFGIDLEGHCTFCNPAALRALGYQSADQLLGKDMHALMHHSRPDGTPYPLGECPIIAALHGGQGTHIQDEVLWKADGTSFHAEYWSNPQRKGEQVIGAVVAFVDITGRQLMRKALEKSEEKFTKVFRDAPMAITLTCVKDDRFVDVNSTFERLTGYRHEEVIGRTPIDLGLWVNPVERLEMAQQLVAEGVVHDVERQFRMRDGSIRFGLASVQLIEIDGEQLTLAAILDVTDRKQALQELKESEERFRKIFRDAPAGMAMVAPDGRYLAVNKALCEFLGYTEEELLATNMVAVTHPEDRPATLQRLRTLRDRADSEKIEKRYLHKNGEIRWGDLRQSLIRDSAGNLVFTVSQILDITERKLMEQELRRRESELRETHRLAQLGSWIDPQPDAFTWSEETSHILGVDPSRRPPSFHELQHLFTSESWERLKAARAEAFRTGHVASLDLELLRPDGSTRWISSRGEAERDFSGRIVRLRGTVQDITERKRMEQALRQRESEWQEAQRLAQLGSWIQDLEASTITWSEEMYRIHGLDPKLPPPIFEELERLFTANSWERLNNAYRHVFETGLLPRLDLEIVRPDGSKGWISTCGEVERDVSGRIVRLRGTAQDITERRTAVLALRESEERFRTIANSAPVMIWMSGTDKLCTYFNKPWLDFTGRPVEAELGNGWAEGVHPDDLATCLETYTHSFDRREPFRMEYRLKRHDGEYRRIIDIGVPRFNADGSFAGYIGSCVDDTDRRAAEEALRRVSRKLIHAQEEERKRIARELHDDINQRLAMLAVELQQLQITPRLSAGKRNERIDKLFTLTSEIASDVQALSHRLHSASLEYLGLVPAVKSFCDELTRHQNVEINFEHSGVPRSIPQEVALALFRVAQEALHNAVKHSGVHKLEVHLCGTPDELQLLVRDAGAGFDPEAAMQARGLGLISMRERILPLKGTISIVSKPGQGTEISVRVPLEKSA